MSVEEVHLPDFRGGRRQPEDVIPRGIKSSHGAGGYGEWKGQDGARQRIVGEEQDGPPDPGDRSAD